MNRRVCSTIVRASIVVHWIAVAAAAHSPIDPPIRTIELFNGKDFDGLSIYFEDESVEAAEIWRVAEGVLQATGVGKGYLRTETPYADYRLHLEWRWPQGPGNSGVMLHVVNGDVLWPKGFECQLASGRAGDFASFVDARSKEEIVSRNPTGYSTGRLLQKGPSAERPLGEWNTLEVVAQGDTLVVWVNGQEVNRMTGVVPAAGMIALQAEGTPIDFRHVKLTPLPRAKDLHAPMPKELQ
jgi:hypothetical protein